MRNQCKNTYYENNTLLPESKKLASQPKQHYSKLTKKQ